MDKPNQLDPADITPDEVLDGMIISHHACPRYKNTPCGAVIKMGFFFDGFGRHRDIDDPVTSRYSNICRLWEAHRNNLDERRRSMPNEYWYRFYFSGLGAPLNEDAVNNELLSAARKGAISAAKSSAKTTFEKVSGVGSILDRQKAVGKTTAKALAEALDEMSWRPIARSYDDIVKHARVTRTQAARVLRMMGSIDRMVTRGTAAVRGVMRELRKNPLKASAAAVKAVVADVALDSIPFLRDNKAISLVVGTGVEDRLRSALRQFEAAVYDAKSAAGKVLRIEVSVFGADRGGVIARAFVNELVRKHKRDTDLDMRFKVGDNTPDAPIEIRMLGLLDAVSSIMAEDKLLSYVPYVSLIKQNHKDRELAVPAAVQRCVHFAAAHELRFYQRLDSLEKTHGKQYLYPGSSEDITGGAAPGSLGARGELQRITLRDMLREALMAGSAVDMLEELVNRKPETFKKFTLAPTITEHASSYQIPELVAAYRALVPREEGLNFHAHMRVFLQWLAVRYRTPDFFVSASDELAAAERIAIDASAELREARWAYWEEENRRVRHQESLNKAKVRLELAETRAEWAGNEVGRVEAYPTITIRERIGDEATEHLHALKTQDSKRKKVADLRDVEKNDGDPFEREKSGRWANAAEKALLSPGAIDLVEAWMDGTEGRDPLPEKVMALFDLLVHDTMLTSWHDHLVSSTLYFRTRDTDAFGETDKEKEKKRLEADERWVREDRAKRARAEAFRLP
ncbi:hypothetical protein [Cupriavidus sp. DL-D2]|uniref:hypothetical protein n=1 Tax=Cupriavidus sp. DL-D2 TaxID=3144974 RepID=UPI003215B0CE